MQSVEEKVISRIYSHGRGWVFTPNNFSDLGSSASIRQALKSLKDKKTIRVLARGIYDYPKKHKVIGELQPSIDSIVKAVAKQEGVRVQPSGAYALNLLGLTEQVPLKIVFLTDGRSRKIKIGKQELHLKRTTPKNMQSADKLSGLVIQAMKHIGKESVDEGLLRKLKNKLPQTERSKLMADIKYAPAWIRENIARIL